MQYKKLEDYKLHNFNTSIGRRHKIKKKLEKTIYKY